MELLGNDIVDISQDFVNETGVEMTSLKNLLERSDFVSLNCDLNPTSFHLINAEMISLMKSSAVLINTARGPVIDEAALVKALREGWIQGAGIDVYEQEPTPADNPLFKLENVILTPHSIALVDEFYITMWELIAQQIRQMIDGEKPETLVNPEVWEKSEFQNKLKKFHQEMK